MLFAHHWWLLAIRGFAALLFGVVAFVWPGVALIALAFLFAAYAFLDGVLNLTLAFRGGAPGERWWMLLLEGVAGVGAAVATVLWPGITILAFVLIVAAWAVITGVFEIIAAIRLRKHIEGEFWLGLAGLVSVLFGLMLIAIPMAGPLVLAWWIGAYAVLAGILMLFAALRLRRWVHGPPHQERLAT